MIPIMLRDLLPRIAIVGVLSVLLYFLEPGFHRHAGAGAATAELGPLGISATLAYLAGLSMIVLLAGFVSEDRRRGYDAIFFSHPTSPLAFYGLKWALAFGISLAAAAAFLFIGQVIAWGAYLGGAQGLLLAFLTAAIYGSLMAFLSVLLPRGDAWVGLALFLPTFFPQLLLILEATLPELVYDALVFLLPPQSALQDVYQSLLAGELAGGAIAYALGYAGFWMLLAVGNIVLSSEF